MNVIPTQLQSEPQQVIPVRTAAQILRGLINGDLSRGSSSDKRTEEDAILARPPSADSGGQGRVAGHHDGTSILSDFRYKSIIETVREFVVDGCLKLCIDPSDGHSYFPNLNDLLED